MITPKAYLTSLKKSVSQTKLEEMEYALIEQLSLPHVIEILQKQVGQLTGKRNRLSELSLVRVRLATLLEKQALESDSMTALNAALLASDLWNHDLNNAAGARKMRLRALWLSGTAFPEYLDKAIHSANGPEATVHLLKDEIQNNDAEAYSERRPELTTLMMTVLENHGKPKKAFFEAMKSIRKWPQNDFLHRQLRKYTELAQKEEEALFTLQDLLKREHEKGKATAFILESIGRVHHLMLDEENAFDAYCRALKENSNCRDAWYFGKRLSEKYGHAFDFEKPIEKTSQDGVTLAEPTPNSHQETVESSPAPDAPTQPSHASGTGIQSLDDAAILEMQTYSAEAPPPLPTDSQDMPPSLPPQDHHDDFDHVFDAQRQKLALDSSMVSEARPISDVSDADKTIVSAIPSLDEDSISSDFDEPTLVQEIKGASSSTTVGFRRGAAIKAPLQEDTSKSLNPLVAQGVSNIEDALSESDLLEGPSVERLEQAFQANDNQVACSILATYDPIYISSKWRTRLLEKALKHTLEDTALVSLKAHFETILDEGADGNFALIANYFQALSQNEKNNLSSLWAKALEYIPEDRPPAANQYELLILGTCTQPHLSEKMFQLIELCKNNYLKIDLFRKLLPIWTENQGRQKIYTTIVQLMEQPKPILELSQDWIKDLPEEIDGYKYLTQSAIQLGNFHLAKEGFEEQLLRTTGPKEKAELWRALASHYLSTSTDYWKEAANACVQAIGFEPQNIDHWSELVFIVGRDFRPQQRKNAHALIEDPNEWVIAETRNFINPILFDLAEQPQNLSNSLRRLLGLLLATAPQNPQAALDYLEKLLDDFPADLLLLEAYAHLLASHGMKAAHKQNDKLNPLENILSDHAEAIDVMKQITLWGDLGAVRWAAGDYSGAMYAIESLFNLLPKNTEPDAMSDQLLDTALSVLDAPENQKKNQQLLIKTLELKAERQNNLERLQSLKRALAIASKHNPAKAKNILLKIAVKDIDIAILESGRKAFDNLDLLEEFCQLMRDWLKEDIFSSSLRQATLETLADVEGQLLRRPEEAAEALLELAAHEQVGSERHAQAAELLLEVGDVTKAIQALRQCVIKNLNDPQSWQKLFECAQKTEHPDLMFFTAQILKRLGYASTALQAALEDVKEKPPACLEFNKNIPNLIQHLKHPFEKGVHADIIDEISSCSVQLFGKALSAVGIMERQRLPKEQLAAQWQLGIKNIHALTECTAPLPIYENHRHMKVSAMLTPTAPPALVVQSQANQTDSSFSHQDSFWVARALYWGLPQYLPVSILSIEELRGIFTALRAHLLQQVHPQTAQSALKSGRVICGAYMKTLPETEKTRALANLANQLRSHSSTLDRKLLQRLQQGISLTSNRLGLLMSGDISYTLDCIDTLHVNASEKSRSVAYRDLLGSAISDAYLSIRKELGWAMSSEDVLPLKNVAAAI